jgi:hypothetical protein
MKKKKKTNNKTLSRTRGNMIKKRSPTRPKKTIFWDGHAECISEDYHGGGAFNVRVDCAALYDSKNVRKLIKWLEKAEKWIANKELYRQFEPRPRVKPDTSYLDEHDTGPY